MHWLIDVFLEVMWLSWSWRFGACVALGVGGIVATYTFLPDGDYRVYLGIFSGALGLAGGFLWELGHKRDDRALLRGEEDGPGSPRV